MDWSKKKRAELVSESCEEIQTKCGCITLKGVVCCRLYDHGFSCDEVEMTAPFPGIKRPLFAPEDYILDGGEAFGAKALQKIYRDVLKERSRERYLQRNKAKIAELLPIWFANDALIGYFDATERIGIRAITRQARRGDISVKEANKELSFIRNHLHKDREREKYDFTKDMNRSLRVTGLQNLEFDYGDACRLFGEKVWEQHLERTRSMVTDVAEIDDVTMHLFNDFSFLYNIAIPEFKVGDVVETIGFGRVMIAVALYRNGEIVCVGAMDDVRGRRALRKLVGDKRLAEILPKKIYNAVTRHESFYVRGSLYYRRFNGQEVITIY